MGFDSPVLIASAVLFGAAVGAWCQAASLTLQARLYLRFASVLLAALAAASPLALSATAALLLLPLAASALTLSVLARFARPLGSLGASLVLVAGLAAGLCALLSDLWIVALIPSAIAGLVIVAVALHATAPAAVLSGLALFASSLAYLQEGAQAGMLLFAGAALLGLTRRSAGAINQQRTARRGDAVSGFHRDFGFAVVRHHLAQHLGHKGGNQARPVP